MDAGHTGQSYLALIGMGGIIQGCEAIEVIQKGPQERRGKGSCISSMGEKGGKTTLPPQPGPLLLSIPQRLHFHK